MEKGPLPSPLLAILAGLHAFDPSAVLLFFIIIIYFFFLKAERNPLQRQEERINQCLRGGPSG